jgi:hypothetical protein
MLTAACLSGSASRRPIFQIVAGAKRRANCSGKSFVPNRAQAASSIISTPLIGRWLLSNSFSEIYAV